MQEPVLPKQDQSGFTSRKLLSIDYDMEDEDDSEFEENEHDSKLEETGDLVSKKKHDSLVEEEEDLPELDVEQDDQGHNDEEGKEPAQGDLLASNDELKDAVTSNEYCDKDENNCGEEGAENIYAKKPDSDPGGNSVEETSEPDAKPSTTPNKPEQAAEKEAKLKNSKDHAKKGSTSSAEDLEDELKAAYKSTKKKPKSPISKLVNLEGCSKLLDQAKVMTFLKIFKKSIILQYLTAGSGQAICKVSPLKSDQVEPRHHSKTWRPARIHGKDDRGTKIYFDREHQT